ncbi:unnamed protein product [Lupinus luteus]|uniref:Uncharacterized protein n=1 Tax=Lupinus luteus TaxID=3873 RepID=A0AAV1X9F6_LUPLU
MVILPQCFFVIWAIQEFIHPFTRNFIDKWVSNGEVAKLSAKAATVHLSFDQQCRFCEKVSFIIPLYPAKLCGVATRNS